MGKISKPVAPSYTESDQTLVFLIESHSLYYLAYSLENSFDEVFATNADLIHDRWNTDVGCGI